MTETGAGNAIALQEVIRPAAFLSEVAARQILAGLADDDVLSFAY